MSREVKAMNLFVAISSYQKTLSAIEPHYAAHKEWLEKQYKVGWVLASGRRNPPVGGILIGRAASKDEFAGRFLDDPFVIFGCSQYEICEFVPSPPPLRSVELEQFLNSSNRGL